MKEENNVLFFDLVMRHGTVGLSSQGQIINRSIPNV